MSCTEWRGRGWPYQLAHFSGRRDIVLPLAELTSVHRKEWESLPVNTYPSGCVEIRLDAGTFQRDAPHLLQYFKTQNPSYSYANWNYDSGDIIQFVSGYFALLFTAMVFVEWCVRARAPEPASA